MCLNPLEKILMTLTRSGIGTRVQDRCKYKCIHIKGNIPQEKRIKNVNFRTHQEFPVKIYILVNTRTLSVHIYKDIRIQVCTYLYF